MGHMGATLKPRRGLSMSAFVAGWIFLVVNCPTDFSCGELSKYVNKYIFSRAIMGHNNHY